MFYYFKLCIFNYIIKKYMYTYTHTHDAWHKIGANKK